MNKKTSIIIAVMVGLALVVGISSALISSGVFSATSKTEIEKTVNQAFADFDFIEEVDITTYATSEELADPEARAESAAIAVYMNDFTGDNLRKVAEAIPDISIETMYQLRSVAVEDEPAISAGILTKVNAKDERLVNRLAGAVDCAVNAQDNANVEYSFNLLQTSYDTETNVQVSLKALSSTPTQVAEFTQCYQENEYTTNFTTSVGTSGLNLIAYEMPHGGAEFLDSYADIVNQFATQFMDIEGSSLTIVSDLSTGEGAVIINSLGVGTTVEELQAWADDQEEFKFTVDSSNLVVEE